MLLAPPEAAQKMWPKYEEKKLQNSHTAVYRPGLVAAQRAAE